MALCRTTGKRRAGVGCYVKSSATLKIPDGLLYPDMFVEGGPKGMPWIRLFIAAILHAPRRGRRSSSILGKIHYARAVRNRQAVEDLCCLIPSRITRCPCCGVEASCEAKHLGGFGKRADGTDILVCEWLGARRCFQVQGCPAQQASIIHPASSVAASDYFLCYAGPQARPLAGHVCPWSFAAKGYKLFVFLFFRTLSALRASVE